MKSLLPNNLLAFVLPLSNLYIDFPILSTQYDILLTHVFFYSILALLFGLLVQSGMGVINHPILSFARTAGGFTLVELMVVIAIIGILSTVGIVVFNGQQKGARDGRRKADINAIAKALENAKGITSTYPALSAGMFANGSVPTDSGTPQYSVCYSTTAGTSLAGVFPTTWNSGAVNPTAPTGSCTGAAWQTINSGATPYPAAGSYAFVICAYLESGYNGTSPYTIAQGATYCRSNQQ